MKKVAIFAEGQTETIFVRELLMRLVDASKMHLQCFELISKRISDVKYEQKTTNPEVYFLIIDVHGDEGVISSIKDRVENMIEKSGYERIIGLRDMYCEQYCKLSPSVVSKEVSYIIVRNRRSVIEAMKHNEKIGLYFAIMEIEAWFLGMYRVFERVDSKLSVENIKEKIGIDLRKVDPQNEFFKPSDQVDSILRLSGHEYKKKKSDIESITSKMAVSDFEECAKGNTCDCFKEFYMEMKGVVPEYLYENQ